MHTLAKLPVTIVTGFLGAGKTTLLRHLLSHAGGRRIAVIVNEFGELGIDGAILKQCSIGCSEEEAEGRIFELANGCLCCTVQEEFFPVMRELVARRGELDHILIETSGLALPKPLVQAFNWPEIRTACTVDAVITVVDSPAVAAGTFAAFPDQVDAQRKQDPNLDHESPLHELFADQLASADLVLLNLRGQRDDLLNIAYAKVTLDISGADRTVVKALEWELYDYNDIKNMPDGCAEKKANPMCIEKSRTCLPGWYDAGTGQCYMEEVVYDCDEGQTISEIVANTSNTCGELPCIGTDCAAGAPEKNGDFATTAGLLQAMSFISADGTCDVDDPTKCKVFPGKQQYCGWAVGLVGSMTDTNCCEEPESGINMMSAAMAAFSIMRSQNWQEIATGASDFTGSSSFTAIYDGVASVGNTVAGAAEAAWNSLTTASNTIMSSLGQEVATEAAKEIGRAHV